MADNEVQLSPVPFPDRVGPRCGVPHPDLTWKGHVGREQAYQCKSPKHPESQLHWTIVEGKWVSW